MNPSLRRVVLICASCALTAGAWAGPRTPDVPPAERRRAGLELALKLAEPVEHAPLGAELVNPFNPVAFGQPDPEELKAIAAAQAAAMAATAAAKPSNDRELLQVIAARVMPSGTLILGGDPLLIFGQKRLRIGDRLTVSYDGRDYPLELTAIERTTFTIRLNNEEITRPIKPGKTP